MWGIGLRVEVVGVGVLGLVVFGFGVSMSVFKSAFWILAV